MCACVRFLKETYVVTEKVAKRPKSLESLLHIIISVQLISINHQVL